MVMDNSPPLSRRAVIAGTTLLTAALAAPLSAAGPGGGSGDFAFQDGHWQVRHRRLRKWLAGNDEWYEYGGSCTAGQLMAGAAGYEDNLLNDPRGAYRAEGLRRFDPRTRLWSIWWWDERFSDIAPPVTGRFENGVGTFLGDDTFDGRPIKVRYIWDHVAPGVPRWQQAFSADAGTTWETNWRMEFTR